MNNFMKEDELPMLLTVMDVAKLLRVSRSTAYSFVKESKLSTVKVGHQFRLYRDDVLAYIKSPGSQN